LSSLIGKWGALATAASNFVGLLGWIVAFFGLRHDLRKAVDERDRKQLRLSFVGAVLNSILFCVAVTALPPRSPSTAEARAWMGIALVVVFGAIHFGIYGTWYRRVIKRCRRAEILADPTAAARHARADRLGRVGLMIAGALLGATIVAIWIFR